MVELPTGAGAVPVSDADGKAPEPDTECVNPECQAWFYCYDGTLNLCPECWNDHEVCPQCGHGRPDYAFLDDKGHLHDLCDECMDDD